MTEDSAKKPDAGASLASELRTLNGLLAEILAEMQTQTMFRKYLHEYTYHSARFQPSVMRKEALDDIRARHGL